MTEELFREDAYLKSCEATVTAVSDAGVELDRTVFYPTGGGQPGDVGVLHTSAGEVAIIDPIKGAARSEERRGGKGCRRPGSADR